MCELCKQNNVRPEYEMLLHPAETGYEVEREVPLLPKGLPKFRHFAEIKALDTATKKLKPLGIGEMNVQNMNPGFVDASDQLIIHAPLQQALANLVTTNYKKYIAGTAPSKNDKICIALVDLSGNKIHSPQYAGWGSVVARYAASTAKIAALYGVYQLKYDLENLLTAAGITNDIAKSKFLGDYQRAHNLNTGSLKWGSIFDYSYTGGKVKLSIGSDLSTTIINTFSGNDNSAASKLIHWVSYPYIGSALLQSGITHPQRGGLWLINDYGGPSGNKSWSPMPSVGFARYGSHTITALSGATFFTLLAQERLVSNADSKAMKAVLQRACSMFYHDGLISGVTDRPPTKCGYITSGPLNDVALVRHDNGKHMYVACVLTTLYKDGDFNFYSLLSDLDKLIQNNP